MINFFITFVISNLPDLRKTIYVAIQDVAFCILKVSYPLSLGIYPTFA